MAPCDTCPFIDAAACERDVSRGLSRRDIVTVPRTGNAADVTVMCGVSIARVDIASPELIAHGLKHFADEAAKCGNCFAWN